MKNESGLYSLITLANFKANLALDDRDDDLSRYCLMTATFTIEQYCHRKILKKKRVEFLDFTGDYVFPLKDYPVRKILAVYCSRPFEQPELVGQNFYHTIPDCTDSEDIPFCFSVSPWLKMAQGISALKVQYWAGFTTGKVPPDLASACMELAAWNMARFKGKKIGVTGAAQRRSNNGEHLEISMPENVRGLLEPYRRHFI
jgi:hypothetical protein